MIYIYAKRFVVWLEREKTITQFTIADTEEKKIMIGKIEIPIEPTKDVVNERLNIILHKG